MRYSTLLIKCTAEQAVSDASLVSDFLLTKSPVAFQELMHRHGPMVWSVGRRMNLTVADAEDMFQATFLVLFEQAARWKHSGSLACWLHGIAWRIGTRLQRNAVRQRQRQQANAKREGYQSSDNAWQYVLDAELARLPARFREPIVLCYLDGMTQREAAKILGWPVGTVAGRLARAKQLLQQRLVRQGVAPAVIASAMIDCVSAGLPPGLAEQAWQYVQSGGELSLQRITQGVVTMTWSKKLVFTAVIVGAIASGGWGLGHMLAQGTVPLKQDKPATEDKNAALAVEPLVPTEKHIMEGLQSERERIFNLRYDAYKNGKPSLEELIRALEQWTDIRLELAAGSHEQEKAILTDASKRSESIYQIAYAKFQAGECTQLEHSTARAARLSMELKLFRCKPPKAGL